ncbi:ParB/Sulfiredoxin domain-containing protein [Nostoc sp. DSM 114161]|jgi:hypothetical protein|uniref:hypothetical protein n=1 Tax=Nostoc sp. DSM 114161 TaxID=3440143 RepID=UPI004045536E
MAQNLKSWNPHEIEVPSRLSINEDAVTEVLEKFSTNGNIPDIIISESGQLIDSIDALEAAKRLDQEVVMVTVQPKPSESLLTAIAADLLYVHPLNSSIYGDNEDLSALKEAISQTGWIKPLVVTPDGQGKYRVVSGNSCFKVGCELGRGEFNCEVKIFTSEQEELKTLLAGNVGREKTIEQKVREGLLWEKIEREEAKSRQGRTGEGQGTTRDIIAKRVGLGSGVNYEHAVAAVRQMDESSSAPSGSVQHHRHQQFKQLLSRPRGVDAAYKLVKESAPPAPSKTHTSQSGKRSLTKSRSEETSAPVLRWIPKELDRVKIIGGPYEGKTATARIILSLEIMAHIDGTPENERKNIPLRYLEPLKEESSQPLTSVTQELKQQQQSLGLGTRSQIFPEAPRNEGDPRDSVQPSSINLKPEPVEEVAIALLKLTPKQLYEMMCRIEPELDTDRLNAIWKALEKSLAHKAA